MNPLTQSKNTTILPLLIVLTFACFALLPQARAVTPAPDGGYPGQNTAEGDFALLVLDTSQGFENTAVGYQALRALSTGIANTAIGYNAMDIGTTGSYNIAIGYESGAFIDGGISNIDIGNLGKTGDSGTIRIGTKDAQQKTFIAGIYGVPITDGLQVTIDKFGHLGTVTSSARFKQNIQPMDKTSEAILSLKPVTFQYKKEIDEAATPQFGLIAEEVAKVDPDLVIKDENGKPYTVRYEAVNAMLLNEFLKEHRKVAEQEATITQLKAELQATATRQQKQIEALTAGLQKVSAQLAVSKPTQQTVANNQ